MWEKIKNILYRNLNMSFGLSGQNVVMTPLTPATVNGEWSCLQILTPSVTFVATIDGVTFDSSAVLSLDGVYTGMIIYGRITQCQIPATGALKLYAGSNLGL